MDYLFHNKLKKPAGFIHTPLIPEQCLDGKYPTMSIDLQQKALTAIISNLSSSSI
jgi:pyrrolidone-carboxylate peptidase